MRILMLSLLLVTLAGNAVAGTILIGVTPTISGPDASVFSYSYTISNDNSSSESLFSFVLADSGPISSIISPSGWTADPLSTPGLIIWSSGEQTSDIKAGSSGVFSFSSTLAPGQALFVAFGSDPSTGFPTSDLDTGFTVGPVSAPVVVTPEANSFILVLIGVGLIRLGSPSGLRTSISQIPK